MAFCIRFRIKIRALQNYENRGSRKKENQFLAASELMWPKYLSGDDAAHGDEAWLPVRLLL